MTLEYIPKISIDKVYNLLPIDYREHTKPADIKEFDDTSKKELVKKRFYKLKLGESEIIHLTLGKALKFVFDKTNSFYEECPEYACKPLFISTDQVLDLLGQEFFEGTPIDEKYASNKISDEDVSKIISKIQKTFSSLEVESTHEAFLEEFNEFKETILNNDSLHLFDKNFLNNCVFPYLEDPLLPKSFSIRWSPGDLAARNILIDDDLNIRIIDCEFAHQTHFHDEDWIRLAAFCSGNFKETPSVKQRLEQVDPWYHIYLCLRQTWLNRTIWQDDDYKHFASEDLYTVLKLTESFGTNNKNVSLLIHGVLEAAQISLNEISIEKDIRIEKENELDAEKQLRLSKENELDAEKQLRLSKENELEVEKELRLSKESELDAEKQLRFSKQSELDQEKQLRLSKESELAAEKKLGLSKENELDAEKELRLLKENELLLRDDKILRMQKSISWRITSPIRFLRRKFLEPSINSVCTNPKYENEGKSYQDWINKYDTISDDRIASFKKDYEDLTEKPLFSIIMPVYDPPEQFFEDALRSVVSQVYTNWELCIADDHSTQAYVHEIIKKYSKKFPKIKVHINEKHSHISETSNNALKLAEGEFIVLMDHDDLLRPHSLLRIAQAIFTNRKLKFIYSDEDKITYTGLRTEPYFKPDWNPELLLSQNYLCHLTCIKKNLVNKIGAFRVGYEGSQDWDLFLRATEALSDNEIYHITEVLYHWRIHTNSTASSLVHKKYCYDSSEKAVSSHFKRRGIQASLSPLNQSVNYWRINYKIPKNKPLVSIIIPTKNYHKILNKCISSILSKTDYNKYEIIIVDNGTDEDNSVEYLRSLSKYNNIKVIKCDGDFNFSKLNNNAAKNAKGEILVLLNNDIEVIKGDWLSILVSHAIRKEVGCVGAKLIYPNNTIQHAGVVLGLGGVAGHPYKGFPSGHLGYFSRLMITQNVEAVTGACLAVRKTIFNEVGGLNENDLKVAFNDVDFCLKVSRSGYRNIMDPNVLLFHHESLSRGLDTKGEKKLRFQKEANYMLKKWGQRLLNDSNYNPNLTLKHENFGLSFPPRLKVSR